MHKSEQVKLRLTMTSRRKKRNLKIREGYPERRLVENRRISMPVLKSLVVPYSSVKKFFGQSKILLVPY